MKPTATDQHLEGFRHWVGRRFGLAFEPTRHDFVTRVFLERLAQRGLPADAYLRSLEVAGGADKECQLLAERLTVPETYFFRIPEHFQALVELVLPERAKARADQRRLRLLSAGCATGEEAYSMAMVIRDRMPELASWQIQILGVDLSRAALTRAVTGRYRDWSLRQTHQSLRERCFLQKEQELILDESLLAMVEFQERNLKDPDADLWHGEPFDVIFCRNVVMYFTPECFAATVERLARALVPGGYLFLGHAETLRGAAHGFRLCQSHDTFYYQRRADDRTEPVLVRPAAEAAAWPGPSAPPPVDLSWIASIQEASERVSKLTECRAGVKSGARRKAEPVRAEGAHPRRTSGPAVWAGGMAAILELVERERFSEALTELRALPAHLAADPDARLLHAVLLSNCGELAASETLCRQLLEEDDMNAGVHYVMALCREHSGDLPGARKHDRAAAYLDSTFAMPHLHLGMMARRSGDPELARRELATASSLLASEDASRILLFGGGFGREALLQMCRRGLTSLGGEA
jgi:chemotaxis protein methyltransferase CheR